MERMDERIKRPFYMITVCEKKEKKNLLGGWNASGKKISEIICSAGSKEKIGHGSQKDWDTDETEKTDRNG